MNKKLFILLGLFLTNPFLIKSTFFHHSYPWVFEEFRLNSPLNQKESDTLHTLASNIDLERIWGYKKTEIGPCSLHLYGKKGILRLCSPSYRNPYKIDTIVFHNPVISLLEKYRNRRNKTLELKKAEATIKEFDKTMTENPLGHVYDEEQRKTFDSAYEYLLYLESGNCMKEFQNPPRVSVEGFSNHTPKTQRVWHDNENLSCQQIVHRLKLAVKKLRKSEKVPVKFSTHAN